MFRKRNRLSVSNHFETFEPRQMLAAQIVGSTTVYAKIQQAVNAAAAGATINVDAGTFIEQVTINKPLTLRGIDAGIDARTTTRTTNNRETILTGITTTSGVVSALRIGASNVTIDGFTIQGQTTRSVDASAGVILLPGISGTRFINNIVQNNVAGLYLANNSASNPAIFQYNVFRNNNNAGVNGGRGIYTDGGVSGGNLTNVVIDNNTFTNNRGGSGTTGLEAAVAFETWSANKQTNLRITNNTFTNNGKSLLFFNTTGALIQGNIAQGALDWYSGSFRFEGNCRDIQIKYNNIINNPGPGVAIDDNGVPGFNSNFVISHNNITGNGTNSNYGGKKLGVVIEQTTYSGTPDVRNNWWGSTTGPSGDGPGTGDGVWGNAYKTGKWEVTAGGGRELFSPWSTSPNPITAPTVLSAPTNLTASVGGDTQINLAWTNTSSDATGIKIERSTDGQTFALVNTISGTATSYADSSLRAGTLYYYRVRATNDAGNSSYSGIASASTTGVSPTTYLSDLTWASATTGYGTIRKDLSMAGNPLTIAGVTYAKGIGAHADSTIVYNLGGAYSSFASDVGLDSGVDGRGTASIRFIVIGDGVTLYDSGALTNGQVAKIDVSIAGVNQLTLRALTTVPGNIDFAHADWGGAILSGTPTAPAAPTNLAATAVSASSIKLAWTPGPANIISYSVERSLDGVNFTTVATGISGTASGWTETATLEARTTHYYRIVAINAVGTSPTSNIASATTTAIATSVVYVSDLTPTSSTVGWGTTQKDKSIKGNTLTLNGQTYTKGIGTHAVSEINYNLAGGYSAFISDVGVDDGAAGTAQIIFRVIADGVLLYETGVLTNTSPIVSINVNVTGVQNLRLVATTAPGGSINFAHADWADARLLVTGGQQMIAAASLPMAKMTLSSPTTDEGAITTVATITAATPLTPLATATKKKATKAAKNVATTQTPAKPVAKPVASSAKKVAVAKPAPAPAVVKKKKRH